MKISKFLATCRLSFPRSPSLRWGGSVRGWIPAFAGMTYVLVLGFSFCAWAAETKPLLLATEASYPPFESINSQGQMVGFDIDILNAVCAHINASCRFVNQPWDSLIPGLELGKFDVIFGAMNITEERQKRVDFTKPYYVNTGTFVAAKSAHLSLNPNDLKGKTIGVQSATTYNYYAQARYGNTARVNTYPSIQDAFLDLQAGRVDLVFGDTPIMLQWLHSGVNADSYTAVGQPITDAKFFGAGDGFAVKKGNTDLLHQLDQGLNAIKADGAYKKIQLKYFGSAQ